MEKKIYNVQANETCTVLDIVKTADHAQEIEINLLETGARAEIFGLFVGNENDAFKMRHTIIHHAPHTSSEIIAKGVLDGNARAWYDSNIIMKLGVEKASGHQREETLLLSKKARIQAIPNLEIAHNDVSCSHSVSATHIDKEKLFFMNARGIATEDAVQELVRGHVSEILDKLPESEKEAFLKKLDRAQI